MNLKSSLLVFALGLPAAAAPAQVALYVTSANTHASSVETGTVTSQNASVQVQDATFWTSGVGGGVTLTMLSLGPVKLGLDLRGSTRPGTAGADTALVGLKVAFKAPLIAFKPYLQASGGYLATRTPNTSVYVGTPTGGTYNNQYAAYEILGGVDYPLVRFIDLRLIELGGGTGYSVGQIFNAGNQATASHQATLFTVNSGVVLHF